MMLRRIGEALGLVSRIPRARCLAAGSSCVIAKREGRQFPVWLDRIELRDHERALEVMGELLPAGSTVQLPGLWQAGIGVMKAADFLTESGRSVSRQLVQAGVAEWRD